MTGCGRLDYSAEYGTVGMENGLAKTDLDSKSSSFATDLCVCTTDLLGDGQLDLSSSEAAVLFDINNKEVVYSKNAFESLYPASVTKIMTALIAIKYGKMDDVLVATNAVNINESGAQKIGIKAGDSMTLYQALNILMLYSANDVANLIAENIGGSIQGFVQMMNNEAIRLGATNTHFVNPHGLSDADHYTTAYDLYLIFNECIKYDEFVNIISLPTYETSITDGNGNPKSVSVKNTNGYVNGNTSSPSNVNVIGGKTGTTSAAGHCLILYSKDVNGAPFISVVLRSESTDSLYKDMSTLLEAM